MAPAGPSLAHAAILGLVHGPTEVLPVSSSAHTELIPWLAGWPEAQLAADARKTLAVALHAGSLAGLVWRDRRELRDMLAGIDRRRLAFHVLALLPPAAAGLAFEQVIERRLGTPAAIAGGLLAGAGALAFADALGPAGDATPGGGTHGDGTTDSGATGSRATGSGPTARAARDARPRDGLALGLAQAAALMPGVSRAGATLAAARALGFARPDAHALSREVCLPVVLGATTLKARRLFASRNDQSLAPLRGADAALALGGAFALGSAYACPRPRASAALLPYAVYRSALALAVLARRRRAR